MTLFTGVLCYLVAQHVSAARRPLQSPADDAATPVTLDLRLRSGHSLQGQQGRRVLQPSHDSVDELARAEALASVLLEKKTSFVAASNQSSAKQSAQASGAVPVTAARQAHSSAWALSSGSCLAVLYGWLAAFNWWSWYSSEATQKLRREPLEEGPQSPDASARCQAWDVVKFALMSGVICFHCAFSLSTSDLRAWQWGKVLLRPVIPCFVFVSGMFSSRVSFGSLVKSLFCPWPNILVILTYTIISLASPSTAGSMGSFNGFGFWYLWCLAAWRLVVTPLIWIGSVQLGLPDILVLLLLYSGAYLVLHAASEFGGSWHEVWRCCLFFAPLFGSGVLFTIGQCCEALKETFDRAWSAWVGGIYLAAWYSAFAMSPVWREWNDVYCADDSSCHLGNYGIPERVLYGTPTIPDTTHDAVMSLLRLGVVLAWLRTWLALARLLERMAPAAACCLAGWGSRSLYAYVLHHITLELARVGGARDFVGSYSDEGQFVILVLFALQANAVLSSTGTQWLFGWFVVPPAWMVKMLFRADAETAKQEAKAGC
eukprot:TRINITY_DN101733_c0_g1_i1.p1 TRINITY_DN101733_c0_g1~~TRINITY_DN101733_c0_g1_i1.p1  ORF type:complete len:543 (-),score=51.22 TRINITY_DN101733_c0_g1_i1:116-1744(-)